MTETPRPTTNGVSGPDGLEFGGRVQRTARRLAQRIGKGYRVQLILFSALVFVSAVPVFLLAGWVQTNALEKEVRSVTEKHLLIAQNLSGALERYVADVRETFRVASKNIANGDNIEGLDGLLRSLNFDYVVVLDGADRFEQFLVEPAVAHDGFELPMSMLDDLRGLAQTEPQDVHISDLVQIHGKPVFFVVRECDDGQLVVGALEPTFLREVQKSIAFGDRGHSMIVDAKGRVVAHPNKDWEATSKDASGLSVVQ